MNALKIKWQILSYGDQSISDNIQLKDTMSIWNYKMSMSVYIYVFWWAHLRLTKSCYYDHYCYYVIIILICVVVRVTIQ